MFRLMVHAIAPMSSKELYTYVVQPFLEGAERLNRAWQGVDFHSLSHATFSLKERIVFLLTGICLVFFPLINSVVWLAWRTFGNPEILSDPFIPASPSPVPLPAVEQPRVSADSSVVSPVDLCIVQKEDEKCDSPSLKAIEIQPACSPLCVEAIVENRPSVETFAFFETSKGYQGKADWKIEFFPNEIRVHIHSPQENTFSRYNKDWQIQEYDCKEKDSELHIVLTEDRRLKINAYRGKRIEEREYKLERNLLWLQQATLGLKTFILADDQKESRYYSIRPDNLDLVEVIARKKGEENLPGYGNSIRADLKMDHCFYRYLREGELWFDPKTGMLRKLIDSGRFMDTVTTEFIQG